ncbi:hypothetical protein IAR55_005089 [Kwoniella newhampshirensis]|uniref:PXA domain-containing protein n=1 Tax=Kwoniella newhampshirensis TaxID=1651941 RepID=A0AAW0YNR5_9TREE
MPVPPPQTARPPPLPPRKTTQTVPLRQPSLNTGTASTVPAPPLVRSRSPVHLPLYRRLLFPLDDVEKIPKLVIGDGDEVDLINERLHNLIALALRSYILSWYARFTRDRSLLPSIYSTIIRPTLSPILTEIYTSPDRICDFLLLDLPTILTLHIRTYWEARAAVGVGLVGDIGDGYHARLPLLCVSRSTGLSDEGSEVGIVVGGGRYTLSPLYLSTLSSTILHQNKEPDVQRLMAREVLARSIFAGVAKRMYEPWFWYSLFLKFAGEPGDPSSRGTQRRHGESKDEGGARGKKIDQIVWDHVASILSVLWGIWRMAISVMALYAASPAPSEFRTKHARCMDSILGVGRETTGVDGRAGLSAKTWRARLAWSVIEILVTLIGPVLDRLIPHLFHVHVLTPRTSLRLIDTVEKLLFPLDGYPGPSPIDPTPDEAADLKAKAEKRLGEIIPGPVRIIFCPTPTDVVRILEPISDPSCNAHLIGMVLDCLIATMIPDLAIGNTVLSSDATNGTDAEKVIFPGTESPTEVVSDHDLEEDLAEALGDG